jgi:Cell division protein CrgA
VPKPSIRRKRAYTPPPQKQKAARVGSPPWLVPLMVTCFVVGLLWIVAFYISQRRYPVAALDLWNMAIGFGLIMVGFVLSTQWK